MSLYEDKYLSVSEIAQFSAQKLNTITKVIQRMLNDGRVTEVCLTEKGDNLRNEAFVEVRNLFDNSFSESTQKEIDTFNGMLSAVLKKLRKL